MTDKCYPDLYVIRHGQTEWNRAGLMQGHHDSPLTDDGKEQAQRLHALLAGTDLPDRCRAWCSPLGRAQQTASIALRGHFDNWTTDDRLMEVGVGEFEGLSFEDAVQTDPRFVDMPGPIGWQFFAPGGETFEQFHARIQSWLDALDAPAVVVTHGITSRVMRSIVLGLGFDDLSDLPGGQGMIHRVRNGVADIIG